MEKCLEILKERFSNDSLMALATVDENNKHGFWLDKALLFI